MKTYVRSPETIVAAIEKWLEEKASAAKAKGCVVGLSGGIDSALVAVLLRRAFGTNMLGVIMPCHSLSEDQQDAEKLIELFSIPSTVVDITATYDTLVQRLKETNVYINPLALANIKPRLRMTTLYALAQSMGYLVCGTSNKAEIVAGYFTKHGDSGADIWPLGDLLKEEVGETSTFLGIPEEIVYKPPSAGLWKGQTDEAEMGLTYDEIDSYIATGNVKEEVRKRIEERYRGSAHKRELPPVCIIPKK
ncbi:MAG: NAD(+) synthase [Aminobacterium colombiense]|nr:NAD(+) synthase [Aminobacterium colombiense]